MGVGSADKGQGERHGCGVGEGEVGDGQESVGGDGQGAGVWTKGDVQAVSGLDEEALSASEGEVEADGVGDVGMAGGKLDGVGVRLVGEDVPGESSVEPADEVAVLPVAVAVVAVIGVVGEDRIAGVEEVGAEESAPVLDVGGRL